MQIFPARPARRPRNLVPLPSFRKTINSSCRKACAPAAPETGLLLSAGKYPPARSPRRAFSRRRFVRQPLHNFPPHAPLPPPSTQTSPRTQRALWPSPPHAASRSANSFSWLRLISGVFMNWRSRKLFPPRKLWSVGPLSALVKQAPPLCSGWHTKFPLRQAVQAFLTLCALLTFNCAKHKVNQCNRNNQSHRGRHRRVSVLQKERQHISSVTRRQIGQDQVPHNSSQRHC